MKCRRCFLSYHLALVAIFPCSGGHEVRGAGPTLEERVAAEYPNALADLRARLAHSTGTGQLIQKTGEGKLFRSLSVDFAVSGEQIRVVTSSLATEGTRRPAVRATCFNKSGAFQLEKSSLSSPYVIKFIGKREKNDDSFLMSEYGDFVFSPIHAGKRMILDHMLNLPGFKVVRVTEAGPAAGKKLLKVEFTSVPDAERKKKIVESKRPVGVLESGWLLVSPDEHWALREYEFKNRLYHSRSGGGTSSVRGKVEYGGEADGVPIPSRVSIHPSHEVDGKSQDGVSSTFEYGNFKLVTVPDSEFTLAAFGVPEVGEPVRRRPESKAAVWLIGLAAAALVSAVLLRRRATRLATP